MTTSTIVTKAEFARLLGCGKSYITKLKDEGRLVLTEDGKVDVEASRARIAQTADPNRDDVAKRMAEQRGNVGQDGDDEGLSDYQKARATKEHYLALQAKTDYERAIAALIPRADVEAALTDLVAVTRAGLENLPHRVAAELVGKDLDTIRAQLRQAVVDLMAEMHGGAKRQLAELTAGEGA